MPEPIHIEIYSRPGCHLCDDAKAVIQEVRTRYALQLRVIDIDRDAELVTRYGTEIPVIFINDEEAFRHRVDPTELERKLKQLWNR